MLRFVNNFVNMIRITDEINRSPAVITNRVLGQMSFREHGSITIEHAPISVILGFALLDANHV